jgi:hypothetical protein
MNDNDNALNNNANNNKDKNKNMILIIMLIITDVGSNGTPTNKRIWINGKLTYESTEN